MATPMLNTQAGLTRCRLVRMCLWEFHCKVGKLHDLHRLPVKETLHPSLKSVFNKVMDITFIDNYRYVGYLEISKFSLKTILERR